ncbi:MAG TPA: DedA family protein [Rhodothermales bacterium]|nr:DedA family protein [Rhodothermales bacterium]
MIELLTDFVAWMESLPPSLMYLLIFAIAYGENVVPPIPGDMIVVFGGYLAGKAALGLTGVIALSAIGGVAGFMTMYYLGRRLGSAIMRPDKFRWLPKDQIATGQKWLNRWGYGLIAVNRFLSGTRSVISLVAGTAKMPVRPVLIASTFSSVIWCALIAWLGYMVGDNWEIVGKYLEIYGRIIFWLVLAIVVCYAGYRIFRRKKAVVSMIDDR